MPYLFRIFESHFLVTRQRCESWILALIFSDTTKVRILALIFLTRQRCFKKDGFFSIKSISLLLAPNTNYTTNTAAVCVILFYCIIITYYCSKGCAACLLIIAVPILIQFMAPSARLLYRTE